MTESDESTDTAGTTDAAGTFAPIPEGECLELLSVGTIGRIAFDSATGIQLLPLNYLHLGGNVYFRVDAASVLGELADGADDVAFGVDYVDELVRQAWSVMVKGRIAAVTESVELATLIGHRKLQPWALGDRQLYLRLEPVAVTGRRVKMNAR